MSPSAVTATRTASIATIRFEVSGDLTNRDLVDLCDAVEQMYQALLAGWFNRQSEAAAPNGNATQGRLRLVGDAVYDVAPSAVLRIHQIQLTSPGPISFDGIGEPIEKLADGIERAYTREERKRSVQLDNEAKQTATDRDRIALERARMELDRDRERDAIATDMQRYEAFRTIFLDLHGPDALSSEDGRRLFAQFLSAQAVLEGLNNKGMLSLSQTAAVPADPNSA